MAFQMRGTVAWTAVAEWAPRLVGFLITLYVGRVLGPMAFGLYALAFSWTHFLWGAIDLGTGSYAIRILAQ